MCSNVRTPVRQLYRHRALIITPAARHRLPAVYPFRFFCRRLGRGAGVDIDHDLAVSVLRFELVEGHGIVAERDARIDDGAPLPIDEPRAKLRQVRAVWLHDDEPLLLQRQARPEHLRRAASYVDRLLKGEKPADRRRQIQTGHQPQNREGTEPHCAALATRRLVRFRRQFSFIPRAVGHTSKLRLTLQGRDRLPL